MTVTGDLAHLDEDEPKEPAWHERTPTLVGASVAALLALLILYFAVSCVAQEFNTPNDSPQYFIDPGGSSNSGFSSTTTTTTSTITSTSPPLTTDINPGDTATTTSSTTTSSTTTTRRYPFDGNDVTTSRRRPTASFPPVNPASPPSP